MPTKTTTTSQPIFARVPEDAKISGYLTRGKSYKILTWMPADDRTAFEIICDLGFKLYCLTKGCSHLNDKDWEFHNE